VIDPMGFDAASTAANSYVQRSSLMKQQNSPLQNLPSLAALNIDMNNFSLDDNNPKRE